MKLSEQQLRDIVKKSLKEAFLGLSFDNFAKNGHFHEKSRSANPVVQTAWRYGWELEKKDADDTVIEGEYEAKIMVGQFGYTEPDENIKNQAHPKASWPMLIAMLNKELRPEGFVVSGANYRVSYEDMQGKEHTDWQGGGVRRYFGTIIVRKK